MHPLDFGDTGHAAEVRDRPCLALALTLIARSAIRQAGRRWARVVSFSISEGKTGFEIRDSRFEIRDSRFEIRDSRFEIRDSRFEIQDSRFKIRDSRFEIRDSRFESQESRFKIQDSRFERREARVKIKRSPSEQTSRSHLSLLEFRLSNLAFLASLGKGNGPGRRASGMVQNAIWRNSGRFFEPFPFVRNCELGRFLCQLLGKMTAACTAF